MSHLLFGRFGAFGEVYFDIHLIHRKVLVVFTNKLLLCQTKGIFVLRFIIPWVGLGVTLISQSICSETYGRNLRIFEKKYLIAPYMASAGSGSEVVRDIIALLCLCFQSKLCGFNFHLWFRTTSTQIMGGLVL